MYEACSYKLIETHKEQLAIASSQQQLYTFICIAITIATIYNQLQLASYRHLSYILKRSMQYTCTSMAHTHTSMAHTHTHACMHTHIHMCTHTHTHVHSHTQLYMHSCTHTHIHTYTHIYIHAHANIIIHAYIYTHTNTQLAIRMHVHIAASYMCTHTQYIHNAYKSTHMYRHAHVCTRGTHANTHVTTCAHMHACACTHTHAHAHIYMYVHMYCHA